MPGQRMQTQLWKEISHPELLVIFHGFGSKAPRMEGNGGKQGCLCRREQVEVTGVRDTSVITGTPAQGRRESGQCPGGLILESRWKISPALSLEGIAGCRA